MPTIREVDAQDERWQRFCASHSTLTLFQSPNWANVIARTYGFAMRVLLVLENDAVLGGLPFAHIEDFRGPRRVALAFADNIEPAPTQLWDLIEAWIAKDDLPWVIRSMCKPTERAASQHVAASHHAIDLPDSFEAAAARFHIKHVQNLKQADKAALRHRRLDSSEGIDSFYALHSQVRKSKHRLLPQPRAFFDAIYEEFFPRHGFVMLAEHDEAVISAMLFVACGKTLYYKFSASAQDMLTLRPNHFLITKAIEVAIGEGYRRLDLGISDTEGLMRFKARIGGTESPVYVARYHPREKTEAVAQIERSLGDLTEILTGPEIPVEAAQRGGEVLYRYFA